MYDMGPTKTPTAANIVIAEETRMCTLTLCHYDSAITGEANNYAKLVWRPSWVALRMQLS